MNSLTNINVGAGYRQLTRGEVVAQGDEFFNNFSWSEDTHNIGEKIEECLFPRRRRVEDYRWLTKGEIVCYGDEWKDKYDQWVPSKRIGKPARSSRQYRRIDPGAGYRSLEIGEVIREGDEVFNTVYKKWTPRRRAEGRQAADLNPTRRKISKDERPFVSKHLDNLFDSPIQKEHFLAWIKHFLAQARQKLYRLLVVGEIVRPGDEAYNGNEWVPVTREGVVTVHDAPIRREIFDYTGGPA